MSFFDEAFEKVVGIEGKYSNNPNDSGGETMFGITVAVARENGYTGPMRNLPLATAKRIYKKKYWDINKLDNIAQMDEDIAYELFDTGVNLGAAKAALFLQSTLNVFNRQGKDYRDIKEDGLVGPATLGALASLIRVRKQLGISLVLKDLNIQQGWHYRMLSQRRPKDEEFMVGWYRTRIELPGVK